MKLKRVVGWTTGVLLLVFGVGLVAYWRSDNSCSATPTGTPGNPMRAAVYCDFGPPEVINLTAVEKPVPSDSQLLVRVHAASVNPLDWHFMRGTPYLARFTMGLRRPKDVRLGVDFAGTVEAVGKNVTRFKVGDEVFGGRTGAFAEYVTIRETGSVALKPANLSFEQAAAVPVAALTALQGLRDQGQIRPGQQVLINGASGGVGTFAVQIAKYYGATATGVCSTRNVEMVKSIGADQVIDYTKDDFTEAAQRYDLIFDNVGNHSLSALRRVTNPAGRYVMIGGPIGRWIDPLPRAVSAMVLSRFVSQEMGMFLSHLSQEDLTFIGGLLASGKVTPVIDRQFKFTELREAIAYLETGHARGKVVVTIE